MKVASYDGAKDYTSIAHRGELRGTLGAGALRMLEALIGRRSVCRGVAIISRRAPRAVAGVLCCLASFTGGNFALMTCCSDGTLKSGSFPVVVSSVVAVAPSESFDGSLLISSKGPSTRASLAKRRWDSDTACAFESCAYLKIVAQTCCRVV